MRSMDWRRTTCNSLRLYGSDLARKIACMYIVLTSVFSSRHRSRRQHYIHGILTARSEPESRSELNVILLLSIERILSNY